MTRVDLSETFSANQLWFRILSGLFQRCSLPKNLWTALIQLWTALKTEIFRAKNQRWNSAVSVLIFSETALNRIDFWIIQNDNFWLIFHFEKSFVCTSISRHITLVFSPVYGKKWAKQIYFSIFIQAKDITHTWIFEFTVTAQVTKQIWFNFSKTFLRL